MDEVRFHDGGRAFTCEAGPSPATPGTLWWWITVSGERQRYAPFRTHPDDTPEALQPRVVAFYEQLLADRARPRLTYANSMARRRAAATEAAPSVEPAQS
jgi:hypothetical protein